MRHNMIYYELKHELMTVLTIDTRLPKRSIPISAKKNW